MQQFNLAGIFDISYYKVWQSNFVTKCDRLLLQKARKTLLQSESGITKCDSYYKIRCNAAVLER